MPGVPFSAYVTEYTTRGGEAFRRTHLRAVLVQKEVSVEAEERGFETKHMQRGELASALLKVGPPGSAPPLQAAPSRTLGRVYRIEKRPGGVFPDRIGLGRAPNADISVPLPRISKYHAYFTSEDGRAHTITDAGSTNGTLVNDTRLPPKTAHALESGDVLQLGPYVFVYLTAAGFADWVAKQSG